MPSVTMKQVRRINGRVYLEFTDGMGLEFNNDAEVLAWVRDSEGEVSPVKDLLRRLLMAWWLKQNPTGNNPALVEGKTIRLNLTGTTLVDIL